MRILFGVQPYSWKLPGFPALEAIASSLQEKGASVVWLYRDRKPVGPGLYVDLECPEAGGDSAEFAGIELEPWAQRFSARYELPLYRGRELARSVAAQFDSIFASEYFDAFFAWNTSESCMGIGRVIAEGRGVPVVSVETGLFSGNFRIDLGHFHDRRNKLPDASAREAFSALGEQLLAYMDGNPVALYRDSAPSGVLRPGLKGRRVRVGLVDSLFSDTGAAIVEVKAPDEMASSELLRIAAELGRQSGYEVALRPHPVMRASLHYRTPPFVRFVRDGGRLEEFVDWADVIITSPSKATIQCLLRGKPTFSLHRDFLYGELPIIRKEELVDSSAFAARLEGYDLCRVKSQVASAVGYLVANRWPSLEAPDAVSGQLMIPCMERLLEEIAPGMAMDDASSVTKWERLRDESENRLIEAAMNLRTRITPFSSRRELLRNLTNGDHRRNQTRVV